MKSKKKYGNILVVAMGLFILFIYGFINFLLSLNERNIILFIIKVLYGYIPFIIILLSEIFGKKIGVDKL